MKRKKTAGKLGYLVLEQIVKIIIFGIMSILCFDQEGLGIVNHIGGGILGIIFAIACLYNLKYIIYLLLDIKDGTEVRRMKYQKMQTKEQGRWTGLAGAYEVDPRFVDNNKWVIGKLWFDVEQNTIENKIVFSIINWIYCRLTSLFFIEAIDRNALWKVVKRKKETSVYRGVFKGKVFKEIYKRGKMVEVVYYRRSRLIKELRTYENMEFEEKIEVRHEKNKRYEFVEIKNLKTERDYSILLQILMQMSEDKKVFAIIMSEDQVKGINKDKMVHYWEDSEPGLCAMELPGLNRDTVNTDVFKNKEMYITVCTEGSDLTWDTFTHDEDPVIWNIDEGKVGAYIHISEKSVEITGAPGLKEVEIITEQFKNGESSV